MRRVFYDTIPDNLRPELEELISFCEPFFPAWAEEIQVKYSKDGVRTVDDQPSSAQCEAWRHYHSCIIEFHDGFFTKTEQQKLITVFHEVTHAGQAEWNSIVNDLVQSIKSTRQRYIIQNAVERACEEMTENVAFGLYRLLKAQGVKLPLTK